MVVAGVNSWTDDSLYFSTPCGEMLAQRPLESRQIVTSCHACHTPHAPSAPATIRLAAFTLALNRTGACHARAFSHCLSLCLIGSLVSLAIAEEPKAKPADPKGDKKDDTPWQPLFNGKDLEGWKKTNFGGEGEVTVEDKCLVIDMGGCCLVSLGRRRNRRTR